MDYGTKWPKGMGIYNGLLYVADIDHVAVIDINTKSINKFYDFPEAQFLNDIAIDQTALYMFLIRIQNGFTGFSKTELKSGWMMS